MTKFGVWGGLGRVHSFPIYVRVRAGIVGIFQPSPTLPKGSWGLRALIHFLTTRAVERSCPCGALILAGVDEGRPVQVDAQPVDRAGEIQALLDNRLTFARLHSGELAHRHEGRIRHGLVGESIHAQHRCPPTAVQPTLFEGIRS